MEFKEVVNDAKLLAVLKAFMTSEYNVENLDFLISKEGNEDLYNHYISDNADSQVNLPSPLKTAMDKMAAENKWSGMAGLMNEAREEITKLINRDVLRKRFVDSKMYTDYLASTGPKTATPAPGKTPVKTASAPAKGSPPVPAKPTPVPVKPAAPGGAKTPTPPSVKPPAPPSTKPPTPPAVKPPAPPSTKPPAPTPVKAATPAPDKAPALDLTNAKAAVAKMEKDLTEGVAFITKASATVKSKGKSKDREEGNRMFESGRMRHDKVHMPYTELLQKDKGFTKENFGPFFAKKEAFSKQWADYRKLLGR